MPEPGAAEVISPPLTGEGAKTKAEPQFVVKEAEDKQANLKRVNALRKAFNLTSFSSEAERDQKRKEDLEQKQEERERAIERYDQHKHKEGIKGVIDISIEQIEEDKAKAEARRQKMSFLDKAQQEFFIRRLELKGVKKARELVRILDDLSDYQLINIDKGKYTYDRFQDDEINALKALALLSNPEEAFRRARKMGLHASLFHLSFGSEAQRQSASKVLVQLDQIPKEKFETFLTQLNECHFLRGVYFSLELKHLQEIERYLAAARNGDFSEEEQQLLKKADSYYHLGLGTSFYGGLALSEALDFNTKEINDSLVIAIEILREASTMRGFSYFDLPGIIRCLKDQKLTPALIGAIREGYEFQKETLGTLSRYGSDQQKQAIENLQRNIALISAIQKNPEESAVVETLREALGMSCVEDLPFIDELAQSFLKIQQEMATKTKDEKLKILKDLGDIVYLTRDKKGETVKEIKGSSLDKIDPFNKLASLLDRVNGEARFQVIDFVKRLTLMGENGEIDPVIFREAIEGKYINPGVDPSYFIPELLKIVFPEKELPFWSYYYKDLHQRPVGSLLWYNRARIPDLAGFVQNGHLTIKFFETVAPHQITEDLLSQDTISFFPEDQQAVFRSIRSYFPNNQLFQFSIANRNLFDQKSGLPKLEFFEALLRNMSPPGFFKGALTEKVIATFPPQERPYWGIILKNIDNPDKVNFINSLGKDRFLERYRNEDGSINERLLGHDFISEEILLPERIARWETLSQVFDRLRLEDSSELRANAYLRIAEAISGGTLTQRTEVEALEGLQRSFSSLFRGEMSPLEMKTYFILRNNLPFATNEALRGEMRQKALNVEAVDRANLLWVHQAIHNYVRVQNPEYMDALRKYIVDGGEENERKLKSLAELYSPDSRPPESFFTEETRIKLRDSEQAQKAIAELVSLTSRYFTLNLADINRSAAAVGEEVLGAETYQYLSEVTELLNKEGEEASGGLFTFLGKMPDIRKDLLEKAAAEENSQLKTNLLSLDTVLAAVYKRVFPGYINLYFEPKLPKEGKPAEITPQDARSIVILFRSLVKTGRLEGDFQGYDQDFVNEWINVEEAGQTSRASFHAFFLLLNTREKHGQLASRKEFESLAQDEMVAMLKRMGMSEEEAIGRVRMTDIVNFYKQSYEFIGEPLENLAVTNFSLFEEQLGRPEEVRYETIMGGIKTGNSVVDSYLEELQRNWVMPKDESGAKSFYDKLLEMSDFKAEKMCRFLIPDYIDQKTGSPQYVKREIDGKTVEIYSFTFYGADGVVMLIDGQKVENPLEKIKEIYKQNIVPAMYHALREGD